MTDDPQTVDRLLAVARNIAGEAELAFLSTMAENGAPRVRLMYPFSPEDDFRVRLGTSPRCRKIGDIRSHPRVTLAYALPSRGAYVTLSGEATTSHDPELRRRYWREAFERFWPDGPEGDDYMIVTVETDRIELMSDADHVTPEPYGLRPQVLVRGSRGWSSPD
jgi:general stress protein 26